MVWTSCQVSDVCGLTLFVVPVPRLCGAFRDSRRWTCLVGPTAGSIVITQVGCDYLGTNKLLPGLNQWSFQYQSESQQFFMVHMEQSYKSATRYQPLEVSRAVDARRYLDTYPSKKRSTQVPWNSIWGSTLCGIKRFHCYGRIYIGT